MSNQSTVEIIRLALDACQMRQTALAANIANANTPGYEPVQVNFEQQLTQLETFNPTEQSEIKPFYEAQETGLSPDALMADSLKNMTHYRALIKGLNQKYALMKMAMHGNNER